ncbi:predicted protein [Uncinocarpus reesii 1704]|uniref:Uncharacterized protein n=1 Tax=Uncinocarpus reesii (strain UAMH 1704) TaxID=336963 RepID=C4JIX5_UNCRE|nr:uncharacterized protein UREG_01582 [Uncinocarpus reesii 1704]EEP76733.1 predicted protein [Uncinocarpus reesii 1704]
MAGSRDTTWDPSGRRDQASWQNQMQSGTQQDYNADEGIGHDPMAPPQRSSGAYGSEYGQQRASMLGGSGGAQGEGWGGRYQGEATEAYPQAGSTQGAYGQQGMSGQEPQAASNIGEYDEQEPQGVHSTQRLKGQQQQAEEERKPSGILGIVSSIGERAQRTAEGKLGRDK